MFAVNNLNDKFSEITFVDDAQTGKPCCLTLSAQQNLRLLLYPLSEYMLENKPTKCVLQALEVICATLLFFTNQQ